MLLRVVVQEYNVQDTFCFTFLLNPGMEFSTLIICKLFITLVGSVYTMSGLVSKLYLGRYKAVMAGRRLSALFWVVSWRGSRITES